MPAEEFLFTCSICRADFDSHVLEKAHRKTGWHSYNVKRGVAELEPISALVFKEQVIDDTEKGGMERVDQDCSTIYLNHSKREKGHSVGTFESKFKNQDLAEQSSGHGFGRHNKLSDDTDLLDPVKELNTKKHQHQHQDSVEIFDPLKCLFCCNSHPIVTLNVEHMQKQHGLFIPNIEYLVDLESFLGYLFTLIVTFQECLFCGSIRSSPQAIRQHMLSLGHCKINSDSSSDFDDFYDLPGSDGVEDGSFKAVNLENRSEEPLELQLDSGKRIAHRSQAHYYKQSLPTEAKRAHRAERRAVMAVNKPSSSHHGSSGKTSSDITRRGYNGLGMAGVSDAQKHTLMAAEKKIIKMETRARNDYRAMVEKAANKQKFFKPDVPGPKNG